MEYAKEWVLQAQKGDKEAFSQLYTAIYQDLYRFALYTLRNKADAEDAVSDTVMDAYREISSLREADAFSGWIFRILSNKCRRRLKEYVNKTVPLPEDMGDTPDNLSENVHVRTCFAKLSEEERLILSLHIFAGYTSKEIGQTLGINDNTVRSKESRALKKLELLMQQE